MIWGMTSLKNGKRRFFGCDVLTKKPENETDISEWALWLWGAYLNTPSYNKAERDRAFELEKLIPYMSSATIFAQYQPITETPLYKTHNLFDPQFADGTISSWVLDNGVLVDLELINELTFTVTAYNNLQRDRLLFSKDQVGLGRMNVASGGAFDLICNYFFSLSSLHANQDSFEKSEIVLEARDLHPTRFEINNHTYKTRNGLIRAALYSDTEIQPATPVGEGDPYKPIITPNNPDEQGNNKPDNPFEHKGEFDDPDDTPDSTQLPPDIYSCTGTQFLTMYAPSYGQLAGLATKMWDGEFLAQLNKAMANPFEAIVSLHILPFKVNTLTEQNIKVGNKDTDVVAPVVSSQFQTFDFGEVRVPVYSGTYLDYSPYTSYNINLPFLGEYPLDSDLITGQQLHLKYHVDILTGDTVAVISVQGKDLYTFTGNCATQLPLTQGDYTNFWRSALNTVFTTTKGVTNLASGNTGGAIDSVGGALSSAVSTVFSQKPVISTKGVIGSNFGNFCCLRPYITKSKPNLLIPDNQQKYTGWASYYTTNIGHCHGYAKFTDVILSGFAKATDNEKIAVKDALSQGVII